MPHYDIALTPSIPINPQIMYLLFSDKIRTVFAEPECISRNANLRYFYKDPAKQTTSSYMEKAKLYEAIHT